MTPRMQARMAITLTKHNAHVLAYYAHQRMARHT
jgi:hypothetical protein